jgi:hypothetical protein
MPSPGTKARGRLMESGQADTLGHCCADKMSQRLCSHNACDFARFRGVEVVAWGRCARCYRASDNPFLSPWHAPSAPSLHCETST